MRSSPHQNLLPSHYPINSTPSNSLSTNLLHHLIRQKGDIRNNQDIYHQFQSPSSFDELTRYTTSPSNFNHSPSKKTPFFSNIFSYLFFL